MLSYSWYLLKVIICSGILFGYYWFFLRNKIFHQYNRFYLLSAMLLSLLLPVLKINFWQPSAEQNTAISVLQVVSTGDEYINNIVVEANKHTWSVEQLYTLVYLLVCLLLLYFLIRTLYRILLLLKKYPIQKFEQVSFVNTEDTSTPFSFLKYIFWNNDIDINTTTGRQIFKHEVAHIQEKHTYDKLFVNFVLIFCWCNPFFWLYRKELNMIHEFIADKKAVEDSDTSAFAAMILQAAYPRQRFELANNFFYSPIKRRLMMLTKIDNPKLSYIARLMVLPLAVLVFAAFTFKARASKEILAAIKPVESIAIFKALPVNAEHGSSLMMNDTMPGKEPLDMEKVLLIINGKIIGKGKKAVEEVNNIKAETVSVKWLTKAEAIVKYGADGADGACESSYKEGAGDPAFQENLKINSDSNNLSQLKLKILQENKTLIEKVYAEKQLNAAVTNDLKLTWEPIVYIGAFTRGRIQLEYLKAQTEIRLTPGYTLVTATVYFHGPGFEGNVVAVTINSKSHAGIIANFNRCRDGAQIAFDNVQVKDKDGNIQKLVYPPVYVVGFEDMKSKVQETHEKTIQGNTANIVFTQVEVTPQFTGGEEAWKKYLLRTSVPVEKGWKAGTYTIFVKFIVRTDGTVSDVTTENYIGSQAARHCIEIIKNASGWQPAVQNGRKVNAYKKQPITFVVEE